MLWLVSCFKLVAEVALLAYAAQAVLGILAGPRAQDNFVHRVFCAVTQPIERAVAKAWPGRPLGRTLPWLGAGLALALWLISAVGKLALCVEGGRVVCS